VALTGGICHLFIHSNRHYSILFSALFFSTFVLSSVFGLAREVAAFKRYWSPEMLRVGNFTLPMLEKPYVLVAFSAHCATMILSIIKFHLIAVAVYINLLTFALDVYFKVTFQRDLVPVKAKVKDPSSGKVNDRVIRISLVNLKAPLCVNNQDEIDSLKCPV